MIWTKVFKDNSTIRMLLESEAIVLLFNTVLFYIIGGIFSQSINALILWVAFFNILAFLVIKLGWVNKPNKEDNLKKKDD